ncbi:RhuM family protein [uncultured Actinomyces sp.]|jgi:DNA-binding protein|uniref:RhuM family protein n=1 Tax=uncultured Actinomyces sp. TaxID=249061 RepID=UPI00345B9EC4
MQYRLRQGRPTTKRFFATVQNKLYYAVHDHTVVEIIQSCARANQPHMGLISWAGSPDGKILPSNVTIGKNYLTRDDLDLGRLVMPSSISMIAKSSTAQAASLRPKSTHALSESEKFHIIQAQEYVSGARVCQGNGVSGSIACEGRRSHDDRGNSE